MNRVAKSTPPKESGFLFISGAGLGSPVWQELSPLLEGPLRIAEKPPYSKGKGVNFTEYVDNIVHQAAAWEAESIILVTHSIGGCIGLSVAERLGQRLHGFVAIAAAIPKKGGSFLSTLPLLQGWLTRLIMGLSGTKPPEKIIVQGMCNDLNPTQIKRVVEGFKPEPMALYTQKCHAPVPLVPKLYIKLSDDKSYSTALQEASIRILQPDRVEILASGHLPMLSQPAALAKLLLDFRSAIG